MVILEDIHEDILIRDDRVEARFNRRDLDLYDLCQRMGTKGDLMEIGQIVIMPLCGTIQKMLRDTEGVYLGYWSLVGTGFEDLI